MCAFYERKDQMIKLDGSIPSLPLSILPTSSEGVKILQGAMRWQILAEGLLDKGTRQDLCIATEGT